MTTLEFTEQAELTLNSMDDRLREILTHYGIASVEYGEAAQSFNHSLLQMIRFGGQVHRDGDLSLILVSVITIGVIWHPKGGDPLVGSWSTHS